ncbi:MAG: CHAT domain-containing protein, partial [Bacteroidetes bacterium]
MKKPIIFLTFANERDNPSRDLKALEPERNQLLYTLAKFSQGKYHLAPSQPAELIRHLNQFPGQLIIFHFSGHADGQQLQMENLEGQAEKLHRQHLGAILATEATNKLKLVFLNACATEEQVACLQRAGVPAIIATKKDISDTAASTFSQIFYQSLIAGNTLEGAFNKAKAAIEPGRHHDGLHHGGLIYTFDSLPSTFPWGLYLQDERIRQWKLSDESTGEDIPQALTPLPLINPQEVIGRDDDLQKLEQRLTEANQVLLVNGLGGIGKTTLAKAYLSQHFHSFDHLAWINIQPGEDSQHHSALSAFANNLDLFENLNLTFNP